MNHAQTRQSEAGRASDSDRSIVTMLATHPGVRGTPNRALARCIEECFACSATCTFCADACLAEHMVAELRTCIRLNLDCADICAATGRILMRAVGAEPSATQRMVEACQEACTQCEAECRRHAEMHEHCRLCADTCARCAEACGAALDLLVRGG